MDWVYYMLGYGSQETPLTCTVFKNKSLMNEINNEIVIFDRKKLKKTKPNKYNNIVDELKQFDITKLKQIKNDDDSILSISSTSTIEYEFEFSDTEQCDEYPTYTIEQFVNNGLVLF